MILNIISQSFQSFSKFSYLVILLFIVSYSYSEVESNVLLHLLRKMRLAYSAKILL